MRIPEGNNGIEIWLDIVGRISLFLNGISTFSACVAKAICTDLFFHKYHWTAEDINTLLHLIKAHEEASQISLDCRGHKYALTFNQSSW